MYIAIILIIGLTLAAAIIFLFCKVRGLNKRLAAMNVSVNQLEVQPRVTLGPEPQAEQPLPDDTAIPRQLRIKVSWSAVSSLSLIAGFVALFQYSKHYNLHFWYFVESPFSAIALSFLVFLFFLMVFLIYYVNAVCLLIVQDDIEKLKDQNTQKRLYQMINVPPYFIMAIFGLILSSLYYCNQSDEGWFSDVYWLPLILSLITALAYSIYPALSTWKKKATLKFTFESSFLIFISSAFKYFTFAFLAFLSFEYINQQHGSQYKDVISLFLVPQLIGVVAVLAFSVYELKIPKPKSSSGFIYEIIRQIARPLLTVQFFLLPLTIVTLFKFDLLSLRFFAERSLIATGFATERMDSETFRQNVWTEKRLGSALQQLSYEEKSLYESEQWRIYFKGTNQTLVGFRKGDVIETFELPTSSPLLRFYRAREISEDNNENSQNKRESDS